MRYSWPSDTKFRKLMLDVEDRSCAECGRFMHVCDNRDHRVFSLEGPLHLVNRLVHCPDKNCPGHHQTVSPNAEYQITMPRWSIDWQVFTWIGQRRFSRHWSVSQIRNELVDSYDITISDDTIERVIYRYQTMLAARHQDPKLLAEEYHDVKDLVLSIDGLQPEKGHETLYVVRELRCKRVWFAESLISSSEAEVRRLLVRAKQWAEHLGKPVVLWVSDKQDAFVKCIREEFTGVPHRYCDNHFLRDVAKPVLEADSHAKVKMRRKVRGLRQVERKVLEKNAAVDKHTPEVVMSGQAAISAQTGLETIQNPTVEAHRDAFETEGSSIPEADSVVLDYCTAVRGILNSNQGGPLNPAGFRMAEGLRQVRSSIQRNLDKKKGALQRKV